MNQKSILKNRCHSNKLTSCKKQSRSLWINIKGSKSTTYTWRPSVCVKITRELLKLRCYEFYRRWIIEEDEINRWCVGKLQTWTHQFLFPLRDWKLSTFIHITLTSTLSLLSFSISIGGKIGFLPYLMVIFYLIMFL